MAHQSEIVLGHTEGLVRDLAVRRRAGRPIVELDDQRILYTEHGVRPEVRIALHEHVRGDRLEAGRGYLRVHMRGAIGMPAHAEQHLAHGSVGRDR